MDEHGKKLLELLDGLPLALAQAAAYCRETECNMTSYVRLYQKQWDNLILSDVRSDSLPVDDNEQRVGTTWMISFKAIEKNNKGAANLLRRLAWPARTNRS